MRFPTCSCSTRRTHRSRQRFAASALVAFSSLILTATTVADEQGKQLEGPTASPFDERALEEKWNNLTQEEADKITTHHLRAIAVAAHIYSEKHDGAIPPAVVPNPDLPPEKRLSGLALLLPYLGVRPSYAKPADQWWKEWQLDEEEVHAAHELFKSIDLTKAWDDPKNLTAAKMIVPAFLSPHGGPMRDAAGYAASHFAFVRGYGSHDDGAYPQDGGLYFYKPEQPNDQISDGTVNTLGIGQVNTHLGPWIAAGSPTARYVYHSSEIAGRPTFGSLYPGCAYFATCDAATYFLDMASIDKPTLQNLTARADGHPIDRKSVAGLHRTAIEWKAARREQR